MLKQTKTLVAAALLMAAWSNAGTVTSSIKSAVRTAPVAAKPAKATLYLSALSMIESGDNDKARGRMGEISRYQCMKHVWKEATFYPYTAATNAALAATVVICTVWNRTGKSVEELTPQEFAVAWHCPSTKRLNREQRDYVDRFSNLVNRS